MGGISGSRSILSRMGTENGTMNDAARPGAAGAGADVAAELTPLALRSLVDSYDAGRRLFSHQLLDGRWCEVDDVYPHETLTSSAISLLGLFRAGVDPADHGIDAAGCLDAIAGEITRTGYRAGIGLALWANAVAGGARSASDYLAAAGLAPVELTTRLLPTFTTMETAWLASGLLHEVARSGDDEVRRLAQVVVDELRTNRYRGATRLMCHAGPGAAALDRARGHIANFADQIYSVQAFAFAAQVLDDRAAGGAGVALADRHCELQGDRGQWWWHYDSTRGHVALRYAVYSVHQHGMAPMALAAVAAASDRDYAAPVAASRAWIEHNESGASMVDIERSTIWRSLERVESPLTSKLRGGLEALGVADGRSASVTLNRETRPYEWAWCLYAAAIENGVDRGGSLV